MHCGPRPAGAQGQLRSSDSVGEMPGCQFRLGDESRRAGSTGRPSPGSVRPAARGRRHPGQPGGAAGPCAPRPACPTTACIRATGPIRGGPRAWTCTGPATRSALSCACPTLSAAATWIPVRTDPESARVPVGGSGGRPTAAHAPLRVAQGPHPQGHPLCRLGDAGLVHGRPRRAQRRPQGGRPVRRGPHGRV